ncbi:hemolysin III family protein [Bacillus tamaricis]|uniref:Hemolysin III family protein n=1 Tax=Evansella tamaricis TaxID=2069301 RepID=A0ABS6JLW5_9BACI|nr:hemolysin III family protein [Evansella tamaricis]MBU9713842.1 hemolysin III family protein [Evansella tamaricis]
MGNTHTYTKKEEVVNAITHGVGIPFGIIAIFLLVIASKFHGHMTHLISASIYGITLLFLYSCSTLLHVFQNERIKNIFEILDHAAIYLFIAGTYTPLMVIVVDGLRGWILLGIIWATAIAGVIFKVFYAKKFIVLSTLFYILMGWIVIFVLDPILSKIPTPGVVLLVFGGLLYTLGTVFYIWRTFYYHHAVWHLFVLVASIAHFLTILLYVIPLS